MTTAAPGTGAVGDPGLSGAFRIDRDGVWRHEDVEVTHPGVLENLYANLQEDGESYHLQVGPLRIPVHVDDAPFVVVRVEPGAGSDTLAVHLTDGSHESLEAPTLVFDGRGIPYCRVKGGRFRARFSVSAWLQLAEKIEVDPDSAEPTLVIGDRRIPLRRGD